MFDQNLDGAPLAGAGPELRRYSGQVNTFETIMRYTDGANPIQSAANRQVSPGHTTPRLGISSRHVKCLVLRLLN